VPRSPAEIGLAWLTEALCREVPGARVMSLVERPGSTGTTTRAAFALAYDQAGVAAGLPAAVFAKCTSSLAQRLMLGLGGLIEGEPGFYAHVRPLLELETPAGYFAAVDERTWRSVVLIEDVVRARGARFWQPGVTFTRSRIEDLLAATAGWHGRLWDSPRLAQWRWLRTPAQHAGLIDRLIGLADRRAAGVRRAGRAIPRVLRERQRELFEGMRRSMTLASAGPMTYLHGDLHAANTYATSDGCPGVADWQVGLKGSWWFDVGYLMATALEVEDRRAWERELLGGYLERLHASGGARIEFGTAWEAYRRATLYPYFAWTYTLGRSRLQPAFQPDEVSLTLIERITAAIVDLRSLAAVGLG
jgi:hypothetical protein